MEFRDTCGRWLFVIATFVEGCAPVDEPIPDPIPAQVAVGFDAPGAVEVPTPIEAPAIDPRVEFPDETVWQAQHMSIDNPARGRGQALLIDRWVAPAPGVAIADIGAGGGFYTFRYAPQLAPGGVVHAIDHDWRSTRHLAWEARLRSAANVQVTQSPLGELGLEPGRFDTVLLISTGMLLQCDRALSRRYIEQIARSLRPGGQLVYVDPTEVRDQPASAACRHLALPGVVELAAPLFAVEERVETRVLNGPLDISIRFRLRAAPSPG